MKLYAFLTSALDGGEFHASVALLLYPFKRRLEVGGPKVRFDCDGKNETFFLPRIELVLSIP